MCKAMNRSFISVLLGGFGGDTVAAASRSDRPVKAGSADDAAFIMKNASSVIIVPGYGMAVAQAQHSVRHADRMLALLRHPRIVNDRGLDRMIRRYHRQQRGPHRP